MIADRFSLHRAASAYDDVPATAPLLTINWNNIINVSLPIAKININGIAPRALINDTIEDLTFRASDDSLLFIED